MSDGDDSIGKAKTLLRYYLIAAYVVLCLLALLSSLDASLVWILGGVAVVILILALQKWLSIRGQQPKEDFSGRYRKQRYNPPKFQFTWRSFVSNFFRKDFSAKPLDAPRLSFLMIGGFVCLFVLVTIIGLFVNEDVPDDEAYVYKITGDEFFGQGSYDSAEQYYRRSLSRAPEFAEAYYAMGYAKSQKAQTDSAVYYFDRALTLRDDYYDAAYGAAVALYDAKRYEVSLERLRYILSRTDSYENAYLLAGDVHYIQQQYDSALQYYEPAYDLGVRSKELLHILAYIYDTRGDAEKAIRYYKETLTYDQNIPEIYTRLGELLPGEEGDVYRQKALGQDW